MTRPVCWPTVAVYSLVEKIVRTQTLFLSAHFLYSRIVENLCKHSGEIEEIKSARVRGQEKNEAKRMQRRMLVSDISTPFAIKRFEFIENLLWCIWWYKKEPRPSAFFRSAPNETNTDPPTDWAHSVHTISLPYFAFHSAIHNNHQIKWYDHDFIFFCWLLLLVFGAVVSSMRPLLLLVQ